MNKKILIILLIIAIVAIAAVVFIAYKQQKEGITKQELLQKFQSLKAQYEQAKAQRYDVSGVERLGKEAKQAFDKGDYKKASELLDKASAALEKITTPAIPSAPEVKVETICTDGIDNDGDGLTDNNDGDCWIREGPIYETHPCYFNGTFKSVTEKIPEIADLGVKTIYLLPIMEHLNKDPQCNFLYVINDHFNITPAYGTEEDLRELIDMVHKYDMKIIFDLVSASVDLDSVAYNWTLRIPLSELEAKAKKLGFKLRTTNYNGLTIIHEDSIICTLGAQLGGTCRVAGILNGSEVRLLIYPSPMYGPAIDRTDERAISYFTKVAEYYVRNFDIDGWRLDSTYNTWNPEIIDGDHSFLNMSRSIKNAITKIKPGAILMPEHGGQYPSGVVTPDLDETSEISYEPYASLLELGTSLVQRTITSQEFVNRIKNENIKYNRTRTFFLEEHGTYRVNSGYPLQNRPLLVAFSTIPRAVMIQTGQEIGAKNCWLHSGCSSPKVDWKNGDYALRNFYKKVFSIRNSHPALKYGGKESISNVWKSGDNIFTYLREYENEKVIVAINFQNKEATSYLDLSFLPKGTVLYDELNNEEFSVSDPSNFRISVPAYGSRISIIKR